MTSIRDGVMLKRLFCGAVVGCLSGFIFGINAMAAYASFTGDHCDNSPTSVAQDVYYRSDAKDYAVTGIGDGYEWGGGCWDSDGSDDTPNQPDSNGEGADCSGFVFKTWKLPNNQTGSAFKRWTKLDNIHGPYQAWEIRDDVGPLLDNAKTYVATLTMDAFASGTHTGMIYEEQSDGFDRIIEAKGDAYGMGIWRRSYRDDPDYDATYRDWAPGS